MKQREWILNYRCFCKEHNKWYPGWTKIFLPLSATRGQALRQMRKMTGLPYKKFPKLNFLAGKVKTWRIFK